MPRSKRSNHTPYAPPPESFHSRVAPTPFSKPPSLVTFNVSTAALIDPDPEEAARPEFVEYFGGGRLLPGSEPIAMLYAGHQFGQSVPRLGDGRALLQIPRTIRSSTIG